MNWSINYLDEVEDDFASLDGSQRIYVRKAIKKTLQNPLPRNEGGYGIPLGMKGNINLTGLIGIKMRGAGLRVIYKLVRTEKEMQIVIIGVHEDDRVYKQAQERIKA